MSLTVPKKQATTHNITVILFVAVVIISSAIPAFRGSGMRRSERRGASTAQANMAWEALLEDVRYLSFAPDASCFCAITGAGLINVYTSAGERKYAVQADGADRLVLAPGGKYAMAYSMQNQADRRLRICNSAGRVIWDVDASGAIWSVDACRIKGGARFVAGAGNKCVYVIDITRSRRSYKWWRAPGAVVSINLDPNGEEVVLGTWQKSRIMRCEIDGRPLWETDVDGPILSYVQLLDTRDRMFVRYLPNRRRSDGIFSLLDSDGSRLWQGSISSTEQTKVVPSPNGQYVCLGSTQTIQHKGKSMSEKHAALYGESGRKLWEKGSLFFQTDPLMVTSGGEVLLASDKNGLFIMRRNGDLQPLAKLDGQVDNSISSRDGSKLLLYCTGGKLCMLDIAQ